MTKRDDRALLHDMLTYTEEALLICRGASLQDFELDRKLYWASVKLIQIVGEASVKVSDQSKSKFDEIPWIKLRGMRNVLVHQYENIDAKIIWQTVSEDLPKLANSLRRINDMILHQSKDS